ncbi:MAG: family 78 glycoside hydrolase catalytic domain [Clostridia bacterium]|nr:family 78 glycoside hydrolase catalytic domain [Clostridia bacterium]
MWIFRDVGNTKRLPIFYKRFTLDKKIKKCVINVSALGIFNVKLNGKEIEDYFMPGWTNYHKYVHLCTYDLTKFLQKDNLIEITLADGWYSGRLGYTRQPNVYGEVNALFAELNLSYKDGTKQKIVTDESWRVGESQIVSSSILDGETVDFSASCSRNIESLPCAKQFDCSLPFEKYNYEPVRKIEELTPTVLYQTDEVIRLDFKQNFAGFVTFMAKGEKGAEITLRHAEVLNEDGTLYYDNLRSVQATDKIILSGGRDKFDPKFTFHGFRYAEITVKGNVKITDIKGAVLSQKLQYFGKFECSDSIVNQIYKNVRWGQIGNFLSLPTDCPQRDERLGWTGDAQVFCNSAMFNADCKRFFENYLKLIRTDILPDGKIPSLVPFFVPLCVTTAGVPGWADAICVIPYVHYLHYRDVNVIKDNLPYAVKHLEYYLSRCEGYLMKLENPFGDWLSVEKAEDKEVISQCFLGLSASLISKMFLILGDAENARKYSDIYEETKKAFRLHYLKENGEIQGDSQTAYAFSLSVGYVEAEEIKAPFVASLARTGWKLTTGFIGVKYLLPALCEIGETELAYRIIKETEYPSWGYTIKQGATTIWERWNGYTQENGFETPSMNSFNHYSLGSCAEWLYSHVLGIKLSEDKPICISPSFSKELSFARGEYMSKDGKIRVEWKSDGETYRLKVKADKQVALDYDFIGREVMSFKKKGNGFSAVLK